MTGYELRRYRVKVEKVGQYAFASFLGVTNNTISRWENNHGPIPQRIADLLSVLEPPLPAKTAKERRARHHVMTYWRGKDLAKPAFQSLGNRPSGRF